MTDFRERYKRVGFGREDVEMNRALRSQRRDEARREMRSEHFSMQRVLEPDQDDTFEKEEREMQQEELQQLSAEEEAKRRAAEELEKGYQKRLMQLEKWREERNRKKLQEKKKAKPVFKVGVVHHRVYSPPLNKDPVPPPPPKLCRSKEVQQETSPPKRVTRATEKRMAVKALFEHKIRENLRSKKNDNVQLNSKGKLHNAPLAPKDHQFKAPVGVTPIPMFGRQALQASKANMEWEVNSSTVSSTSSGPTKSFVFDSSQSVSKANNHSFILSQSTTRRSKSKKLNVDPCDSSINKSLNDSLNNSSVEAVTLKISSDDQEMLDDQENVDVNCKIDSSFTKSTDSPSNRRSSRMIKPPLTEANFSDKKGINSPKNSSFSNQTKQKILKIPIILVTPDSTVEKKVILPEEESVKNQEIDKFKNDNTFMNSNFSSHIKTKPAINRRSTRIVLDDSKISEKLPKDASFTLKDQEMIDNSEKIDTRYNTNESSISKENTTKLPATRRKSTRMIIDDTENLQNTSKNTSFMEKNKEEPDNQESVDSNMNSSITKQNETKSSGKRKSIVLKTDSTKETSRETSFIKTEKASDLENQANINDSLKNIEIKKTRRSTRMLSNVSVEKLVEEASSILEDQKVLDNQDNVDCNMDSTFTQHNKSKSPEKQKSTVFKSDSMNESPKDTSFIKGKKVDDYDQQSINDSPKKFYLKKSRRSTRKLSNVSIENLEETSPVLQDQKMLNNQDNVDCDMDSTFTQQNKTKSPEKRKSTVFKSDSKKESPKDTSFIKAKKVDDFDEESINDSSKKIDMKKSRRSTRILFDVSVEKKVDETSSTPEDQEMPDADSNNLVDSVFFGETKTKSPGRRKSINISPDKSLIKFSPRQSIKPQPQPKKSPANHSVKFSPTEAMNESTSSEPTKHKSPKEDSQNLSLSLAKGTSPDRPPAFFSPYIVASRGKSSVRKEVQRRRFSQPVAPDDIPTKDTVMQKLNVSVEEEERAAQYYKYILEKEIERLSELCYNWNEIKEAESTPEDIQYDIQAAVGQTQLLLNKKFARFRSLVLDCETGKGEMLVTHKDLQGFWEMMYMEIRDCDNRFSRLEELKARNWVDEQIQIQQPKKKVLPKKPVPKKKTTANPKTSSLRAHIMAARKKKMAANGEVEGDVEMMDVPIVEKKERLQEVSEHKETDISSPTKPSHRTSTPNSSNKWQSLLKKVQLSQSRKSTTSPLIMMKLSQMCKTPEVQLDDSIVYINSDRTPAKSILKTTKDELLSSVAKSTNKVFFKEQPNEVQEFECNDEAEMDNDDDICLENIEEFKEPIERKLNFEGDSFNSSRIEDNEESEKLEQVKSASSESISPSNNTSNQLKIPKITIIEESPTISESSSDASSNQLKIPKIVLSAESPTISISSLSLEENKSKSSIRKNSTKLKKQISFKDEVNESYTRVLRSSKFTAPPTPIPKLREPKKEENEESMEIDDSIRETNNMSASTLQQKEFYLNSEGIICERIVQVKVDTPRISRLRRSNSEKSYQSPKSTQAKSNAITKQVATPRLRRNTTHVSASELHSPATPVGEIGTTERKSLSTPRIRRQSSKRSFADTTLTEDNVNGDEATTPKIRKKILNLNETASESGTPLRRTKSLNVQKHHTVVSDSLTAPATPKLRTNSKPISSKKYRTDINEDNKEIDSPKLKRTNSKSLNRTKTSSEENSEVSTPIPKRMSTKKHQQNTELNEQETDVNAKLSRTSSIRKTDSKKRLEDIEQQSSSSKTTNEASTQNSRRKSLRVNSFNL